VNKRVIAIAAAASVLLVGVWYFAFFSGQSKSIQKSSALAAAANVQAGTVRSQIVVLQHEKAQLPVATAKLTTLALALPSTPALDKLIDNINVAATQSGVNWQSITPSKPATYTGSTTGAGSGFANGMQSVSVALQVGGSYKQILAFVDSLNGMSRLLDVGSINLSGIGSTTSSAQLTCQIFFVPPAPGSTTATTVTP
jgi:Tfp pilus assembly protein PilO